MSFDSVVAGINGGVKNNWYKCDDASGAITDSGDGTTRNLSVGIGIGSLTYEVTGSEDGGTSGKAISFPHDKSMQATQNDMQAATTFSCHIAFKTINNAANMDSVSVKAFSIADQIVGTPEFAMSANRNSDSNGNMRFFIQGNSKGVDCRITSANFPNGAAWDDDDWHYYVIVQAADGNGLIVYVDGVKPTQITAIIDSGDLDDSFPDVTIDTFDNMALGSAADTGGQLKAEGVLDNWILWHNYALTAQEAADLFSAAVPPTITSTTRRTGRRTFNDAL